MRQRRGDRGRRRARQTGRQTGGKEGRKRTGVRDRRPGFPAAVRRQKKDHRAFLPRRKEIMATGTWLRLGRVLLWLALVALVVRAWSTEIADRNRNNHDFAVQNARTPECTRYLQKSRGRPCGAPTWLWGWSPASCSRSSSPPKTGRSRCSEARRRPSWALRRRTNTSRGTSCATHDASCENVDADARATRTAGTRFRASPSVCSACS